MKKLFNLLIVLTLIIMLSACSKVKENESENICTVYFNDEAIVYDRSVYHMSYTSGGVITFIDYSTNHSVKYINIPIICEKGVGSGIE